MTKVKVLIEGYAKETSGGWLASSTTTLIVDSDRKIIVDPGINRELLLKKLEQENLTPDSISHVFLTHHHLDHAFLASLFEKAIVLDGETIYEKDKESEYEGKIPGTKIDVILTPGHAPEHASLVVTTEKGKTVIAADLFWWTDGENQQTDNVEVLINREDPFTTDMKALIKSRKTVLTIADFIIPGHGKLFKNSPR